MTVFKKPPSGSAALPDEFVEMLSGSLAPVAIDAGRKQALRERLMARLEDEESGITRSWAAHARWAPFLPGVDARVLHESGGTRTWIARLAAGARVPAHVHDGIEEVLILEGHCFLGETLMVPGDYQRSRHGSRHAEMHSVSGCLLMVRTAPA